jgi:hypothetical protein
MTPFGGDMGDMTDRLSDAEIESLVAGSTEADPVFGDLLAEIRDFAEWDPDRESQSAHIVAAVAAARLIHEPAPMTDSLSPQLTRRETVIGRIMASRVARILSAVVATLLATSGIAWAATGNTPVDQVSNVVEQVGHVFAPEIDDEPLEVDDTTVDNVANDTDGTKIADVDDQTDDADVADVDDQTEDASIADADDQTDRADVADVDDNETDDEIEKSDVEESKTDDSVDHSEEESQVNDVEGDEVEDSGHDGTTDEVSDHHESDDGGSGSDNASDDDSED